MSSSPVLWKNIVILKNLCLKYTWNLIPPDAEVVNLHPSIWILWIPCILAGTGGDCLNPQGCFQSLPKGNAGGLEVFSICIQQQSINQCTHKIYVENLTCHYVEVHFLCFLKITFSNSFCMTCQSQCQLYFLLVCCLACCQPSQAEIWCEVNAQCLF